MKDSQYDYMKEVLIKGELVLDWLAILPGIKILRDFFLVFLDINLYLKCLQIQKMF